MLDAIGLGGTRKRWPPAKELQKSGKVSKHKILGYLQYAVGEVGSTQTVELLVQMRLKKKGDDEIRMQMNAWQCELIEHSGLAVDFGRMQLQHWIDKAGTPDSPECDKALVQAVKNFEAVMRATNAAANQECEIRLTLGLREDGEDEDGETRGDRGPLMERRFPKAESDLLKVAPISRDTMLTYLAEALSMVLSSRTREILAETLKDYSTWKPEKRQKLCSCMVMRWQCELMEHFAFDRRLGLVECGKPADAGDSELMLAQVRLFKACQALTLWFSMRPGPGALPRDADRRIEAWSLLEVEAQLENLTVGDEKGDSAGTPVLQREGPVETALLIRVLNKLKEVTRSEDFASAVEEAAASGDPFAPERWTREVYEAFGIDHDYGNIVAVAYSYIPEVAQLSVELTECTKALKPRIAAGLRRGQAAKPAAAKAG